MHEQKGTNIKEAALNFILEHHGELMYLKVEEQQEVLS